MKKANEILDRSLLKFLPPKKVKLADWAEENFNLASGGGSASGRLNLNVTPHLREILNEFTNPKTKYITWISSAQSAKTTALMIVASYYIQHDPTSILFLEPTDALAMSVSTERFAKVIQENPGLRKVLHSKESKNNEDIKIYPGGYTVFGSAGSYADLISRPVRIAIMDEVDAPEYSKDLKDRGSPISMAIDRTVTFHNRKILRVGTPGTKGISNLYSSYDKSDMRVFMVPCIYCDHRFELTFELLKWEKESEGKDPWLECPSCKGRMKEHHKTKMVQAGEWMSTNPNPEESNHAGFKLNQMYSLFPETTWEAITTRFLRCKRNKDYKELKTWTQQVMAQPWDLQYKNTVGEHDLQERLEDYTAEVPAGVGLLFCGVDIQHDRVEATVIGVGKRGHIWLIDHKIIYGNPELDPDSPGLNVWTELDAYLLKPWKHELGQDIYIRSTFVDAGDGQRSTQIKKFCFQRTSRRVFPTKGSNIFDAEIVGGKTPFWIDPFTKRKGVMIGVSRAKEEFFSRLDHSRSPEDTGYVHFPKKECFNLEYFSQLTAEKLREEFKNGSLIREWVKIRARNETLDCFIYAYAAFLKEMGSQMALLDEVCDYLATPPVVDDDPLEVSVEEVSRVNSDKEEEPFDFYASKNRFSRH